MYRRVAGAEVPHTHGITHLWDALAGIFLILRLRRTTAHDKAYTALRSRNYKDFSCRMYVPRNPRVVFLDRFRHQKSRKVKKVCPQRPPCASLWSQFCTPRLWRKKTTMQICNPFLVFMRKCFASKVLKIIRRKTRVGTPGILDY